MNAFSLMLIGMLMGIIAADDARAKEPTSATDSLVRGNNAFAFDVYARIGHTDANRVFSPLSISTALAMTYAGALGGTAEEMAKTLRFGVPPDQLHRAFHQLIVGLESRNATGAGSIQTPDLQLFIANALWHQAGERTLPDFQKQVEIQYQGGVYPVDFRNASTEARKTINTWVESQTNGKIRDLIAADQIGPRTLLVLTNALYFKGLWASPFSEKDTEVGDFHVSPKDTTRAPMMHQVERFGYLDSKEFQAIELPYRGRTLSLVVLLPKATDGLEAVESSLDAAKLATALARLSPHRVEVTIPRFRITSEFDLKQVLSSLGMTQAFDPLRADFSGMTGTREFALSAVIHKAFVDVQESGTEATAATAVVVMKSAMPIPTPPVTFRADHPFLFVIRDMRTGSILFLGRLLKPAS